jgi:hypothetical protein
VAEAAQGYTSTDWIDPSKIGPPNWLHLEDAFQQMYARAGSGELAADDLSAWLRSRDWLSVELRVNGNGDKTCRRLTADFWRDAARLEAVPDADAVDHLEIHCPDYVHPSSLPDHTSFFVQAVKFARELERLYPAILYPTTAAPPPPPASQTAPEEQQGERFVQPAPSTPRAPLPPSHKPTVPSKKRKRKRPTAHDRLISLMTVFEKDLNLKPGMLPAEVLRAVKQPYKDKYHNEPSKSAVTRAYDQIEATLTNSGNDLRGMPADLSKLYPATPTYEWLNPAVD